MDKIRPEYERIRDEIEKCLSSSRLGHCPTDSTEAKCADLKSLCGLCWADRILSIKGIAILDDEQSVPCGLAITHNSKCPALEENFKRVI